MEYKLDKYKLTFLNNGFLREIMLCDTNKKIQFRNVYEHSGIAFYGEWAQKKHLIEFNNIDYLDDRIILTSNYEGLELSLIYFEKKGSLCFDVSVCNTGLTPFQPKKFGLKLGLDTYMDQYPNWLDKYFPTLLRCEQTHFWGYFMSPNRDVLVLTSKDPVASWSIDYNLSWGYPFQEKFGGHRIETVNIDLLNALPLPNRHPHNLYELKRNEQKTWSFALNIVNEIKDIQSVITSNVGAPFIKIDKPFAFYNEAIEFDVISKESIDVKIQSESGRYLENIQVIENDIGYKVVVDCLTEYGVYTIKVKNSVGMESWGNISVLQSYNWNMKMAFEAALKYLPKPTSHCESYYSFYSLFLGIKFVDKEYYKKVMDIFDTIYPIIFSKKFNKPKVEEQRIQNTSTMIGILVDKYNVTRDINDLELAAGLADWLIKTKQTKDGSFKSGKTHYTSVIYPAKSIMELMEVERELGIDDEIWQKRYKHHYQSVEKAMNELIRADGNIDTEGELTFEDGMISCSALQLGLFALKFKDGKEAEPYKEMCLKLLHSHDCLTQLIIPDSRQRGGTLRFWESQYDVGLRPNMMNSPHGWTSWRTYATYYAYLLTGNIEYIEQTINALHSCIQSLDQKTGKLRWAFVANPYIEAIQINEIIREIDLNRYERGHHHALEYKNNKFVLGETYIDMVSDKQGVNFQDNDVHEHFKCLAEIMMGKAYVYEKNGEIIGVNCKVEIKEDVCIIHIEDTNICKVHCNLESVKNIKVNLVNKTISKQIEGLTWINL